VNGGKCNATRADGRPCSARALPGQTLCWAHAPSLAAKRRRAHVRGGQNKATARRSGRLLPGALRRTFDRLEGAMDEVEGGSMNPRVGMALASLAAARVRVFQAALVEQRLDALEKQVGQRARAS
jgi:hypothetical protein